MSEKIVQLNEEVIKGQLKELVRGSVEETLNELLEKEAETLTQAARYERNEARQGYRSGHYDRNLSTTSGDVTLHMPRLKGVSFETAIIERYRRRESSVEEALIEMYLAGVSVRRVEDITEVLWGTKVSPSTISELNKKAYVHIEDWRNRPLQGGKYPYVYVDGIYLRRNWGGEYENVSVLVAIAVNEDGYREVLGAAEGMKESLPSEHNMTLVINGVQMQKLICTDEALDALVYGFLYNGGRINSPLDIKSLTFSSDHSLAEIELETGPDETAVPVRLTGFGGAGLGSETINAEIPLKRLFDSGYVISCAKEAESLAVKYAATGGMHFSALFDDKGLLMYRETGLSASMQK